VAFPQVASLVSSIEDGDTKTHEVPLPSGSGGVLLGVSGINGVPTVSNLPWAATLLTDVNNFNATANLLAFHKIADGTETASCFTTSSAEQSATQVFRVTGAHNGRRSDRRHGFLGRLRLPPDPPRLNPAGWDT